MAFKMKNSSLAYNAKSAGDSRIAMKFNKELKKASSEGKLKGEFKEAVDSSPATMKSAMKATDAELMAADQAKRAKAERQQDGKGKTDKERSAMTKKDNRSYFQKAKDELKQLKAGAKNYLDEHETRNRFGQANLISGVRDFKEGYSNEEKKQAKKRKAGDKKSPMNKTYNQAWKDMSEAQQSKFANKQAFVDKAKADNKRMYGSDEPTNLAKEASKATGEKVTKKDLRKTDYSAAIRVHKMNPKKSSAQLAKEKQAMQDEKDAGKFGDSKRAAASTKTGKDDRKYRKAEKARRQASEALAKGNTKRAERKLSKAMRKETKGDKARKA